MPAIENKIHRVAEPTRKEFDCYKGLAIQNFRLLRNSVGKAFGAQTLIQETQGLVETGPESTRLLSSRCVQNALTMQTHEIFSGVREYINHAFSAMVLSCRVYCSRDSSIWTQMDPSHSQYMRRASLQVDADNLPVFPPHLN